MATSATERERVVRTALDLGDALAEVRAHRDQTQAEVAHMVGMNRTQLAHLEGGRSGRFLSHLLSILDVLGAEVRIHWKVEPPVQRNTSSAALNVQREIAAMSRALRLSPEEAGRLMQRATPKTNDSPE